jgi:hypothetical protein
MSFNFDKKEYLQVFIELLEREVTSLKIATVDKLAIAHRERSGSAYGFRFRGITFLHSQFQGLRNFELRLLHPALETECEEELEFITDTESRITLMKRAYISALSLSKNTADLYALFPDVIHDAFLPGNAMGESYLPESTIRHFRLVNTEEIDCMKAHYLLKQLEG